MSFNFCEAEATAFSVRNPADTFNIDIRNPDDGVNANSSSLTQDRTLNVDVCDGDRELELCGDLKIAGDLTTAGSLTTTGANSLELVTTGPTMVTLPTMGTLANEAYVDTKIQGLDIKESVRLCAAFDLASVGAGFDEPTLTRVTWDAMTGPTALDGVTLANGDRIIAIDSTARTYNGIWVRTSQDQWDRPADFDSDDDVTANAYTWVEEGTNCGDHGYVLTTNDPITIGTIPLSFTQFTGAGQIMAGDGIEKSGNTLSADLKANGGLVFESAEIAVDLGASNITGTLAVADGGTGQTSFTMDRVIDFNGTELASTSTAVSNLVTQVANGTDNAIPKYDGASKIVQASGVTISDSNDLCAVNNVKLSGELQDNTSGNTVLAFADSSADDNVTVANGSGAVSVSATGASANIDLNLAAKGTGEINAQTDVLDVGAGNAAAKVQLRDADASNFVGVAAPAVVSADYCVTLPAAQGSPNQTLVNDGLGNLSWQNFAAANARHFQVSSIEIAMNNNTTEKDTVYFPWNDALYGGATSMTVNVYASSGSMEDGTLRVTDSTDTTLAGGTITVSSGAPAGIFTAIGVAVPSADDLIKFKVVKGGMGAGTHPRIFAITIELA